ncbi:hypothetical protein SAMN03159434_1115 [Enterobacter sp. NFR05]|nr:hypothetical protein SAMN03159434_1115 [Enterobacter sp. NFR05]
MSIVGVSMKKRVSVILLEHGANPNPVNKQGRSFSQMLDRNLQQVKQGTEYYDHVVKLKEKIDSMSQ